jgi:hypothetical protein
MSVPVSIDDFCAQHGLVDYIPMMHENEVDLDVVRDLSAKDWAEMGMRPHDVQRLMAATKTLPPGSFRVWGSRQNPVMQAVQDAMARKEKSPPPKVGQKTVDAHPAPVVRFGAAAKKDDKAPVARFGTAAKKDAPEKKVPLPQCCSVPRPRLDRCC